MTAAALSPNESPAPPAQNVAQKRKLASFAETDLANGVSSGNSPHEAPPSPQKPQPDIRGLLSNILTILQSHDTTPSILEYSLDNIDSADEPSAKRPKLSDDAASGTIAAALAEGLYESLEAVVEDVDRVCGSIIRPIKERESAMLSGPFGRHGQLDSRDKGLWASVLAFQRVLGDIVKEENRKLAAVENEASHNDEEEEEEEEEDGATSEVDEAEDPVAEEVDIFNSGRPVLSIFANAQGPKQLFSSLQRSVQVGRSNDRSNSIDTSVEVTMPLREYALPNFITTTKVPTVPIKTDSKSTTKTFGERFGPPRHMPRLHPPEPSSKLVTKSNVISWIPYETLAKQASRRTYHWCSSPQPSGMWITYNNSDIPTDPSSPEEKRRQRDRALSIGAAQPPPSEATRIAAELAKDDALFRSAFSSFAPSRDNSGAVVSDDVRGRLWWSKIGRHRAARVLVDADLLEQKAEQYRDLYMEEEDRAFKEAVESFDESTMEDYSLPDEKPDEEKDADGLLQDINELIETLYSYQRIRNSTLPSNSAPMTPVGQRNAVADMIGTPSSPSSGELEIYKTLKEQLTLLILQLPPYAVAKLNGNKLEELNISTNIMVETSDGRGVLEDDTPRQSAAGAAHAQQHITPRAPLASAYGSQQGGHYARGVAPAPARQAPGYFPQQIQSRTPSVPMPRQSNNVQPYSAGYPNTAVRPGYNQPAYSQPGYNSTPGRPNYPPSPGFYPATQQQAAAAKAGYGGYYAGTPQGAPSRNYSPQTALPNYARPAGHAAQPGSYGYQQPLASPHVRTTSPMQAAGAGSPPAQYARASNSGNRYYGPVQAAAIGPTGFHTSMTNQEQQNMIDRQRAQLALQQAQARLQAMGPAAAVALQAGQAPLTPQPQQAPQQGMPQMNGTPAGGQ